MVTVKREGGYLVFWRDGVEFYDSAIPCEAEIGQWFRHMDGKMWFQDVRKYCIDLIHEYHNAQ